MNSVKPCVEHVLPCVLRVPYNIPVETLRLRIEKKGRGGKTVTVISGFTRHVEEIERLASDLKRSCGSGGTVRGTSIEVQGDVRDRVRPKLSGLGFTVKG